MSEDSRERGELAWPASTSSSMAMTIWIGFSCGATSIGLVEKARARGRVWRIGRGLRMRRHIVRREWQKTVVRAKMKMMNRMWNMSPLPTPVAAKPR